MELSHPSALLFWGDYYPNLRLRCKDYSVSLFMLIKLMHVLELLGVVLMPKVEVQPLLDRSIVISAIDSLVDSVHLH